jgi:hypothetical protein
VQVSLGGGALQILNLSANRLNCDGACGLRDVLLGQVRGSAGWPFGY